MSNLDFAANMLNAAAPPGERLAYVNPGEEGLLRAIGGSGRPSSGGVPSYKKGDVEASPPRDYSRETRDTLQAQIDLAPELFASEMNVHYGRPAYARMERDMLWESLLGTERAMPGETYAGAAGAAGPTGAAGPAGAAGVPSLQTPVLEPTEDQIIRSIFGTPMPEEVGRRDPEAVTQELAGFEAAQGAGSPQRRGGGLLELYEEHVAPSIMRQQQAAAEGEIAMLRDLGPEFLEAQRAADPESEKIRRMLQRRAQEGLAAGQDLTAEEMAGVTEGVRAGQAARGEAFQRSQPGMIQETLARLGAGRQAEAQRIARAQQVLQQTSAVDPFLALTGRTARMPGQVAGQFGTTGFALQSGPQLFNPESAYAGALASQNQANIMNARMATSANQAALTGGLIGGLGALGGGMFAGAGAADGFGKMFS